MPYCELCGAMLMPDDNEHDCRLEVTECPCNRETRYACGHAIGQKGCDLPKDASCPMS